MAAAADGGSVAGGSVVGLRGASEDWQAPFRLVNLLPLMQLTHGAPGISVGLIDGPVALDHSDLGPQGVRVLVSTADSACSEPEGIACRHGTAVAGLLHAAREGPVPGVCPGCSLVVRAIFSEGGPPSETDGLPDATVAELTEALWAVIAAGARIINLSVGLAEPSLRSYPALDEVLTQAARRGVIVVAASGNQGALGSSALTRHPWVIPVVGCDSHGRAMAQSNLSASVGRNGLMAPGHDIRSTAAGGGYARFSGSSAAVPFVSGALALLWSLFPRAGANQILLAVRGGSASRRSVTPPLLNAWAAYQMLAEAGGGMRAP